MLKFNYTPLTVKLKPFMLCPLSQKTKVGIDSPCKGAKTPITLSVFLRPQFLINTGLIRVLSSMVDCFRGRKPARSFARTVNLTQSTAQCLTALGGGYSLHKGVTAMLHHKTIQRAKAIADSDGIIRVQNPNFNPPKGYKQLCICCRFDRFSGAYNYCPQCGCSALSHGVYVPVNEGV